MKTATVYYYQTPYNLNPTPQEEQPIPLLIWKTKYIFHSIEECQDALYELYGSCPPLHYRLVKAELQVIERNLDDDLLKRFMPILDFDYYDVDPLKMDWEMYNNVINLFGD